LVDQIFFDATIEHVARELQRGAEADADAVANIKIRRRHVDRSVVNHLIAVGGMALHDIIVLRKDRRAGHDDIVIFALRCVMHNAKVINQRVTMLDDRAAEAETDCRCYRFCGKLAVIRVARNSALERVKPIVRRITSERFARRNAAARVCLTRHHAINLCDFILPIQRLTQLVHSRVRTGYAAIPTPIVRIHRHVPNHRVHVRAPFLRERLRVTHRAKMVALDENIESVVILQAYGMT